LQSTVSVLSEDLRKEIVSLFEQVKRNCRNETEEVQAQLDELRQSIHSVNDGMAFPKYIQL
jgi:hypothetical protein